MSDPASDFLAALQGAGLAPAGSFVPRSDGQLHRYRLHDERPGKRSGWYVLHPGDPPHGHAGDWRTNNRLNWVPTEVNGRPFDQEQWEAAVLRRAADEKRQWDASARRARALWQQLPPANEDHPYLSAKQVVAGPARVNHSDRLVLPVFDAATDEMMSLQFIGADGSKRFLAGGRTLGGCCLIGPADAGRIIICEGYATGATTQAATGDRVASAFSAGNLHAVAKALKKRFPTKRLLLAADNDDKTVGNPGISKAFEASLKLGISWVSPPSPGDFNDLGIAYGHEAVRVVVDTVTDPEAKKQADALFGPNREPLDEPAKSNGSDCGKPSPDAATGGAVQLDDFVAYMPQHTYIFRPTGEMWPGASINSRIPPVILNPSAPPADRKTIKASTWIDQNHPVEQMTWAPGLPVDIKDKLVTAGGWIERPGATVFNLYRPPSLPARPGDAKKWVDHVTKLYGDDAPHLISWLAHRVQFPGEKINHALVLGGDQGIGKDTLLEPVKHAVGPWNFAEVSPVQLLGRFNGFLKSVILRISEARDLGEVDRFAFYDHSKAIIASPPDVLRVDEKNIREYSVFNVCGVILTTNHKTDGLYLPADDRRHFVAWSDVRRDDFEDGYWTSLYHWFAHGGCEIIAHYLAEYDLTGFDPKAPPPKTEAFWEIVDAGHAPENAEVLTSLEMMGFPDALTIERLTLRCVPELTEWLKDRKNRKQIPHRLEDCGYVRVHNHDSKQGLWTIGGKKQAIYARTGLPLKDRIAAARGLT